MYFLNNKDMHPLSSNTIPKLSIALISACALAYEVLLMRIFSIVQWHHFAYMIISLALLGYGVSGTFLSIVQDKLDKHYFKAFYINALLFGISIIVCFLLAQNVSFNPEEIFWHWKSYFALVFVYLILAVPFFFAANCIALSISHFKNNVSKVYALDLIGAGVGSIAVLVLLFSVFPKNAIYILCLLGLSTSIVSLVETGAKNKQQFILSALLLVTVLFLPHEWLELKVSQYKSLPQTLNISGTEILEQRSSPLGLITVVESKNTPLRYVPGLSLYATSSPPEQLAVFTDADAMTVIAKVADNKQSEEYLDFVTSALAYHLTSIEKVLVLGAGGGFDVLQARYHDMNAITAIELNPQVVELIVENYAEYSGNLYSRQGLDLKIDEARGFVSKDNTQYDLIQLSMLDSFGASSAGLYALNESYLYTVEAFRNIISRLSDKGYLSITRWIQMPPKDTLKVFATAIEALHQSGIKDPENRLILIRGWQTSTLLIKKTAVSRQEIEALKQFCKARGFDVAYYPGMREEEANQFNILKEPYFFHGAKQLSGATKQEFMENYKFNINPAIDNKPYFFNFFKWKTLQELFALRSQGGMAMVEWGYIVVIATLVQALLLSVLLIVAPLRFIKKISTTRIKTLEKAKVLIYFSAIGLAFLFLEIVFIQKFLLYLHHPLYSVVTVLTSFLIFSGIGSAFSAVLLQKLDRQRIVIMAVVGIVLVSLLYTFLLPQIFQLTIGLNLYFKMGLVIVLIAPLALCMGMPFPVAMSELNVSNPSLVPWAWGINGCASVISAVLATLVAVEFGFNLVVVGAIVFYILAAIAFPNPAMAVTE